MKPTLSPEALATYREAEQPYGCAIPLALGFGLVATLALAACLAAAGCYGIYLGACELLSKW